MTDLLPCPFCGGSASIERFGDRRVSTIYQCDNCSCSLETGEEWGYGAAWNRRANPQDGGTGGGEEVRPCQPCGAVPVCVGCGEPKILGLDGQCSACREEDRDRADEDWFFDMDGKP